VAQKKNDRGTVAPQRAEGELSTLRVRQGDGGYAGADGIWHRVVGLYLSG
jgi:hypothetical protein